MKKLHKKAEAGTGMSLEKLIQIVLAAVAIIVLYVAFNSLFGVFVPNTEQATLRNFEMLSTTIKNMPDESTQTYAYYMKKYVLVGFESEKSAATGTCNSAQISSEISIVKPFKCGLGTEGCLCLCPENSDFTELCQDKETTCKTIDDFGKDLSFMGGNSATGLSCNFAYIQGSDKPQTIYLSKNNNNVRICKESCTST